MDHVPIHDVTNVYNIADSVSYLADHDVHIAKVQEEITGNSDWFAGVLRLSVYADDCNTLKTLKTSTFCTILLYNLCREGSLSSPTGQLECP